MTTLTVEYRPISTLLPRGQTPRTHSRKQIRQIADSIGAFGWTNPILVDAGGGIVAGHGRLAAARLLGLDTVPTIRLPDMTEAQLRAYSSSPSQRLPARPLMMDQPKWPLRPSSRRC